LLVPIASNLPGIASRHSSVSTTAPITFGFLPQTARWTNRPTFQQVVSFDSHRAR